ncbi:heterochromatin protein (macronuclear) [Tetrahymena thermophila SB210]|uniref:Heterochromatin protein n=1 Tax=Tetrahymena thermophila (strain SB210) TaxID=312017 RepID=Q245V8_TETTS|nr:heterochromatin protein [Tetrahymena thermophila SB210]EAS03525.1 heterochromatin protein [Tetrahymena thermophila SB210]|eukprot:XP_001023770.1 heterochromatin protein [Tetrahymena thermophila SB210]
MSDTTTTANSKKNTKINGKQQGSKDKAEKKEKAINKKKYESEDEEEEEEEEFYIVEKILDYKKIKNRDLFLVKWEGYEELTWEPKSNLSNVKQLVENFLKTLKDKGKKENSENLESSSALQEGSESKKQQLSGGKIQKKEVKSPISISKEKQAEKVKQDEGSHLKRDVEDHHNISISSMKGKKDDDGEQNEEQENKVVVKQEDVDEEKQSTKKRGEEEEEQQQQQNSKQIEEEEEGKDVQKEKKQQNEEKQDIKHLEQKESKEDHDAIQQQQKNTSLNKKRKKEEQSQDDIDEQNEQDKPQDKVKHLPEILGNLEEHIPLEISKAVYKTSKFQYLVQWKQQQGIKIIPSFIFSDDLLKRYSDLIVHFYEDKALKRK